MATPRSASVQFAFDPARDAQWRDRFASRLHQATQAGNLTWQAAMADRRFVDPPFTVSDGDIAVHWLENGPHLAHPRTQARTFGALHWSSLDPSAGPPVDATALFAESGPEQEMAQGLRRFEEHPHTGDDATVLASPDGRLFASFPGFSTILPMRVPFEDYVELQLAVLGMDGLCLLLCDLHNHGLPDATKSATMAMGFQATRKRRAKAFLSHARRLFPDQPLRLVEQYVLR